MNFLSFYLLGGVRVSSSWVGVAHGNFSKLLEALAVQYFHYYEENNIFTLRNTCSYIQNYYFLRSIFLMGHRQFLGETPDVSKAEIPEIVGYNHQ